MFNYYLILLFINSVKLMMSWADFKKTNFEFNINYFQMNVWALSWMPVCIIIGIEHKWFLGFPAGWITYQSSITNICLIGSSLIHHRCNIIFTVPSLNSGTIPILWCTCSIRTIKPKSIFQNLIKNLLICSWKSR